MKWIVVPAVLLFCVGCALFLRFFLRFGVEDPIEQIAQTVLEDPHSVGKAPPPDQITADLANFLGWYQPMVKDASPEVRTVMKRFDAKLRASPLDRNEEIERFFPTHLWIQKLLDMDRLMTFLIIQDISIIGGHITMLKTIRKHFLI